MGIVKYRGLIFDILPNKAILMGLDKDVEHDREKEIEVPTLVNGVPVRKIADGAFFQCSMKKWCLPVTIDKIGSRAFGSSATERIVFYATSVHSGQSIIQVGDRAFKRCKNLKLFSTMQYIAAEELAFCNCPNLTTEPMRHEMRFSKINNHAFTSCDSLKEIFIRNGAGVFDNAFTGSAIDKIHIDKNVHLPHKAMEYIKNKNVSIITCKDAEIADLAYDGIHVTVI